TPDGSVLRMNYLPALAALSVRNNVQAAVTAHPVDFTAVRVDDSVWLYRDEEHQALISSREGQVRYQPIAHLQAKPDGSVTFEDRPWAPGFPLALFEDPLLALPTADRAAWLSQPHSEREWLDA